MKAAILHYHLGVGGVSSVVAAQSRAMTRAGVEHLIFCGEPVAECHRQLPLAVIPELGYQQPSGWETAPAQDRQSRTTELVKRMQDICETRLGGKPSSWHAHNSTLARHPALPHVVAHLAELGCRLWLHVHDLAEDGRPEYLESLGNWKKLYPHGSRIHYRFLSDRDRDRLVRAGLPRERAHVIANPLEAGPFPLAQTTSMASAPSAESKERHKWLMYPVRGIRRKNLGEVLLLASLLPPDWSIAITQAPNHANSFDRHQSWRQLAMSMDLPIEFAVVDRISPDSSGQTGINAWRQASRCWLSTSVEEGFGMVFAESMAMGKSLLGRRLSHLHHAGQCDGLYERVLVPMEWIGREMLKNYSEQVWWALQQAHGYRKEHPPAQSLSQLQTMKIHLDAQTQVDFGNLPEPLQEQVLWHLRAFPAQRDLVRIESCMMAVESAASEPCAHTMPASAWLRSYLQRVESTTSGQPMDSTCPTAAKTARPWPWMTEDHFWQQILEAEAIEIARKDPSTRRAQITQPAWLDRERVLASCLWSDHLGQSQQDNSRNGELPFRFLLAPALDEGGFPKVDGADAIIFDVYGTLLRPLTPTPGGVRKNEGIDASLHELLHRFGYSPQAGITGPLEREVRRLHASSPWEFPEVDLRKVWKKVLKTRASPSELEELVVETERIWHPVEPMPGAFAVVRALAEKGHLLGLISNAQCNTPHELEPILDCFQPELTIFSYRHGHAKPGNELFQVLTDAMAAKQLATSTSWLIGNDPIQDIAAAKQHGFRTAWFSGEPSSLRPGWAIPTCRFGRWTLG